LGEVKSTDFLSKYYGGLVRRWDNRLFTPDKNNVIKYLDASSMYPFSIKYQNLFDILNGDYKHYSNVPFSKYNHHYDKMIFSSTFIVKSKTQACVIIEIDKEKNGERIGIGYLRSFNSDDKVQNLEHQFCIVKLRRGDSLVLTKSEIEMNRLMYPNEFKKIQISKIIDAMIPTNDEKTNQFISLYGERQKLKKNKDAVELFYKLVLNSTYGKISEANGKFFCQSVVSAVTSFARYQILSYVIKAKELGLIPIYSDTDSIYIHGASGKIKNLQSYSNKLNPYPMEFGEDNLKDEKEDIRCFLALKRKVYNKVVRGLKGYPKDKNILVVKKPSSRYNLKWRDALFRCVLLTSKFTIKEINKAIQNENFSYMTDSIKNRKKFENLSKEVYEKHKGKTINEIVDVNISSPITNFIMIHLKNKTNYACDLQYGKFVRSWTKKISGCNHQVVSQNMIDHEQEQIKILSMELKKGYSVENEQELKTRHNTLKQLKSDFVFGICTDCKKKIPDPYSGLFFEINNDYSFNEKKSSEIDWSLNYDNYLKCDDEIPYIRAKDINDFIFQDLQIDTIRIKTRSPISLLSMDLEDKKAITNNLFFMDHSGKVNSFDLKNYTLMYKLSMPDNLDHKRIKYITRKDGDRYANIHLFVSNINQLEASARINKVRMFVKHRNIFNIYRFICEVGDSIKKFLISEIARDKKKYRSYSKQIEELSGVELESFRRFSFITQCDISQPTTYDHVKALFNNSWDSKFSSQHVGQYIAYQILKWFHLTGYNKKSSAENKLKNYSMEKFEADVFNQEIPEGFRSEIKFKLNRCTAEMLSYAYVLNSFKQEELVEKIINNHKYKFTKKTGCIIEFNNMINGEFEFSSSRCIILFNTSGIIKHQVIWGRGELGSRTPWDNVVQHPPKIAIEEDSYVESYNKNKLKMRFYVKDLLSKEKFEAGALNVIRNF